MDGRGPTWPEPNDERDPAVAEQLAAGDGDEAMRRREFLQRAAVTGGLAMGLAGVLHPDSILAEASKRTRVPVPDPRNVPLDTIVVLMMENRSLDHCLGWVPGADGAQAGLPARMGAADRGLAGLRGSRRDHGHLRRVRGRRRILLQRADRA